MKRIVVVGEYGIRSLGDEAMRRKLPRYWEIAAEVLDGR